MNSSSSSSLGASLTGLLVIYAVILVVAVWAYVRIIRRAGYSGWWVLIGLVPLLNVVMFLVFAFKEWPIQRELAYLRAQIGRGGSGYGLPAGYGNPPAGYGNPPAGYGNPPSGYGYPSSGYGSPSSGYGNPSSGYGNPPSGYGNPPSGYGNPPSGYGNPPAG
jgi:hypothetical protein